MIRSYRGSSNHFFGSSVYSRFCRFSQFISYKSCCPKVTHGLIDEVFSTYILGHFLKKGFPNSDYHELNYENFGKMNISPISLITFQKKSLGRFHQKISKRLFGIFIYKSLGVIQKPRGHDFALFGPPTYLHGHFL